MATSPEAASKGGSKRVRILRAHEDYQVNHVISLPAKEAAAAIADGWADDGADAVAYALANEPQPQAAKAEG